MSPSSGGGRSERIAVLPADPDLAARLEGARRARAEGLSVARVVRRDRGVWETAEDADHARDGLGLLVVEGTLVRRVGMAGRHGAELLSVGTCCSRPATTGRRRRCPSMRRGTC